MTRLRKNSPARQARLSPAMREALADLKEAPMTQRVHGWANNPARGHGTNVIDALVRRGLAGPAQWAAQRHVEITEKGRAFPK